MPCPPSQPHQPKRSHSRSRPSQPESRPSSCRRSAPAAPARGRSVHGSSLILGGMEGFVLQDLQVGFNDRFGVIAVPAVLGASASRLGSMTGSRPPSPLPTSTPIPFPTTGPNSGLLGSAGAVGALAGDARVRLSRAPARDDRGHCRELGIIADDGGTIDSRSMWGSKTAISYQLSAISSQKSREDLGVRQ